MTLPARAAFDWGPPIGAAAGVWALKAGAAHGLRLGGCGVLTGQLQGEAEAGAEIGGLPQLPNGELFCQQVVDKRRGVLIERFKQPLNLIILSACADKVFAVLR